MEILFLCICWLLFLYFLNVLLHSWVIVIRVLWMQRHYYLYVFVVHIVVSISKRILLLNPLVLLQISFGKLHDPLLHTYTTTIWILCIKLIQLLRPTSAIYHHNSRLLHLFLDAVMEKILLALWNASTLTSRPYVNFQLLNYHYKRCGIKLWLYDISDINKQVLIMHNIHHTAYQSSTYTELRLATSSSNHKSYWRSHCRKYPLWYPLPSSQPPNQIMYLL